MTDTLPQSDQDKKTFEKEASSESAFDVNKILSSDDLAEWHAINKLSYQLVMAEHRLDESKLIDFLIPSYRSFVRELAKWKTGIFPVIEAYTLELGYCAAFLEAGNKLSLGVTRGDGFSNSSQQEGLLKLGRSFKNSLSVNQEDMHRSMYDIAAFSEKLLLFEKHTRHYFNVEGKELKQNDLANNIVKGKLSPEKKIFLQRFMNIVFEIKIVLQNILMPLDLIKELSFHVAKVGRHIDNIMSEGLLSQQEDVQSELRRVTNVWNNLNSYAVVYANHSKR